MKKTLKVAFGLIAISAFTFGLANMDLNAGNKIKVHHGSSAIEISISTSALNAHLAHGDEIHKEDGGCSFCM